MYLILGRPTTKGHNRKYDKIVKSNAEVVELALNDAIRFSDKDLDSIGLDLDEIKKGSDRVLAKFKSAIRIFFNCVKF